MLLFTSHIDDIDCLEHSLPEGLHLQYSSGEKKNALLLDTFDHTLSKSGKLMIYCKDYLWMFDQKNPHDVLVQEQKNPFRFTTDIEKPIHNKLCEVSPLRALLPLTKMVRQDTCLSLLDNEKKTHVRGNFYVFNTNEKQIILVYLRALRGYEKSQKIFTQLLSKQAKLCHFENLENIYSLFGIEKSTYCAKPIIPLTADMPIWEMVKRIILTYSDIARKNEDGIKKDYDTEFLHDYRVSMRKIRSTLSLFKDVYKDDYVTPLKQKFSTWMHKTNRLRDLDVYFLSKLSYQEMLPSSMQEGLEQMFFAFAQERQAEQRRVARMLSSKSYDQAISDLIKKSSDPDLSEKGENADIPSFAFACKLIQKHYRKVYRIASSIDEDTPDETIHRLRIQYKKLRYIIEFFSPLFPKPEIQVLVRSLKQLQNALGNFNDLSVQQKALLEFGSQLSQGDISGKTVSTSKSVGGLIAMLSQQQDIQREKILAKLNDLCKTRSAFESLFSVQENP